VGDIGLAAFVRHGVVSAPLGGDPAEVTARVFALSIVAHGEDGPVPGGEKGTRGCGGAWLAGGTAAGSGTGELRAVSTNEGASVWKIGAASMSNVTRTVMSVARKEKSGDEWER
jgi:hypothetical protein